MKNRSAMGFTLLEMSIVILIIGTIVGAILLGKSLLVTSRLQTAITDANSYISAIANFKQTYQSLPGDMAAATNVWGFPSAASSSDTPPYSSSCATLTGTGTQTCNGNGDGKIGGVGGQEYETFRFWQHLYNAGMFSQSVTGINNGNGVYDSMPGVNVPASAIRGSGFSAVWFGIVIAASGNGYCGANNCYAGSYGNVLQFGGISSGNITNAGIITPDQAASIDAKIDDGIPSSGKVQAYIAGSCTVDSATVIPGAYNVTSSTPGCSLIFVTGF